MPVILLARPCSSRVGCREKDRRRSDLLAGADGGALPLLVEGRAYVSIRNPPRFSVTAKRVVRKSSPPFNRHPHFGFCLAVLVEQTLLHANTYTHKAESLG